MLDHDESNMHTLQLELNGRALLDSAEIVIADIRDASPDPAGVPAQSGQTSSSTPPRTSTCRCSSSTPARA